MLSRTASNLYWIGRYMERAEFTVSLVEATIRLDSLGIRNRSDQTWRSALAVRYAFGARLLLPLACGAAHLRPDLYLAATFVSSATWSVLFALLGFWFGETALQALAHVQRYDEYAAGVAAGVALLVWLMVRRRRRAGPAVPPRGEGA